MKNIIKYVEIIPGLPIIYLKEFIYTFIIPRILYPIFFRFHD